LSQIFSSTLKISAVTVLIIYRDAIPDGVSGFVASSIHKDDFPGVVIRK
jgi:hypothetical protein